MERPSVPQQRLPDHNGRFQLVTLLSAVGPGFVYALTVLGTGDIVSNIMAGAGYRYSLIWALGMTLVFRYIWVNTSAKYVLVSGESLLTGYARVGKWVPLVVLLSVFPTRYFGNQYLILLLGSSAHMLFPLPTEWSSRIWGCTFTLIAFSMMFWGGYPVIERFCKVLVGVMGAALLVAALLSDPDPAAILSGTFIPSVPEGQGLYSALLIVMALVGTEAGSTANLTYVYFMSAKGWKGVSYLRQQRFDLAVGVLSLFVMGGLLQVAAGGVLHPLGIQVQDPADLGRVFSETQGLIGLIVFALGLWGSCFSSFIGFNTGYALIITDYCRTSIPRLRRSQAEGESEQSARKDPIYRGLIVFWVLAPLYIVFSGTLGEDRAVWLVLMLAAFLVLLIPILGISLLKITNDRELMGEHRNGWVTNLVLTLLVIIAMYFAYENGTNLWHSMMGTSPVGPGSS